MHQPSKRSNGAGVARIQRKAQILTCLYDQWYPEEYGIPMNMGIWTGWLTSGQIARCCGMSASPHFRGLLNELYQDGAIVGKSTPYRSTMTAYYWKIHEDARYSKEWIGVFDAYLGEDHVFPFKANQP